ncbi:MAG: shikimate dehydrogenase [Alphaproteobacteria bacterium]|nr:shikimate dehydrogenase [Alphaproteobacteria bacterium]
MRTLTGRARLAGVMGWPVSHSRSPGLHGYWLALHGIDGAYLPLAVRPEHAREALRALPKLGFQGCNVTVPHKETAAAEVDILEPFARRVGAVNTVIVHENGRLEGRNTDGFGFLENLRQGAPGWRADRGPAVVLGAGGAARAVVAALLDAGAPEVRIVNRTLDRAARLAEEIGGAISAYGWDEAQAALEGAALLANTTTLGLTGQAPLVLDLDALPRAALVTDAVYAPLETGLLARARARGHPVVDGIGWLLHQARPGFAAWFGVEPEVTPALRAHVLA